MIKANVLSVLFAPIALVIQAIKSATGPKGNSRPRRPSMMAEMYQGGHIPSTSHTSSITEEHGFDDRRMSAASQDLLCASPLKRRSLDLGTERRASSEPQERKAGNKSPLSRLPTSGSKSSLSSQRQRLYSTSEGRRSSNSSQGGRRSPSVSDERSRKLSTSSTNGSLPVMTSQDRRSSVHLSNELLAIPLHNVKSRRPSLPAIITISNSDSDLQVIESFDDLDTKKKVSKSSAFLQFLKKRLGN